MSSKFIDNIAVYIRKHGPNYGIKVYSPIIAQAILESARGTSELAVHANNFFGLKYKTGRCPTASGIYQKVGSEQNADGSYSSSKMNWCMFKNMEDCVIGYYDFINCSRYASLKGVTDPETYLKNIKAAGYATSLKYVDNLMNVIKKYDLTKYDVVYGEETKMLIAIDAGHGLKTAGKRCDVRIDPKTTREWTLNDRIADRLQELLKNYDCATMRVDDTTGDKDITLANRVTAANNAKADVYISIHHNAGANCTNSGGVVVFYYSSKAERATQAQNLYNAIVAKNSLVGNRSSKVIKKAYYVLKNTNMPAFLIENGFMDSKIDTPIILTAEHAEKTAQGLLAFLVKEYSLKQINKPVTTTTTTTNNKATNDECPFKVKFLENMNVRKDAGTKYDKVTECKKNVTYTIVATKKVGTALWGKLKSGAGWVCIAAKYCNRV